MLLIETYLDTSTAMDGLGCFTKHPLALGTPVLKFCPPFDVLFTYDQLRQLPKHKQLDYLRYSWLGQDDIFRMYTDDSRHINHDFSPTLDIGEDGVIITTMDLPAGAELLADYTKHDSAFNDRFIHNLPLFPDDWRLQWCIVHFPYKGV